VTSDVERALSLVFEGAGEERRQRLLGESGSPEEKEIFENLVEFALASCLRKDLDLPELGTGLVFAGFGEDEIFPSYSELKINGLLGSQVWRFERRSDCIGSDSCVSICPFAQSDVIETFMNGISREHEDFLLNGVMPRILESLDKDLSQEVLEEAKRTFGRALKTFSWENFSRPVVDSTSFLHFDELATMAETLVNLTSFKRRVSPFAETVGGPVDVAVITKGDGFVWIKRKHYFPSEINYRFFKNYLREVEFLSEQGGDENVFNGQEGREDLFSQAGF
jgi:ferredoxin